MQEIYDFSQHLSRRTAGTVSPLHALPIYCNGQRQASMPILRSLHQVIVLLDHVPANPVLGTDAVAL